MIKDREQRKEMNEHPNITLKTNLRYGLIIALCFLWTSTGYLTWMYHLLNYTEASTVDWLTEVIGYFFQAAGLFLFSIVQKHNKNFFSKKSAFVSCIGADFIFMILSVLINQLMPILIFGYLMNLFHGIIAGFYLTLLATQVEQTYRSIVFGGAYASSSIASWLLSMPNHSNLLRSGYVLIIYSIFICITIGMIIVEKERIPLEKIPFTGERNSTGTIALSNEVGISMVLWILGYCLFGFLAVFRVVLFSDIARMKEDFLYMAGFGLMFGRIGDATGNLTGIILNDRLIPLVAAASICFVVTYVVFFLLYNRLYMPDVKPLPSREERMLTFIRDHELSSRETEVLQLITEGASNGEISAKLFITENTVKLHVRNILKKTGCSNRTELLAALNRS